jgi:hypothetical protein
MARPRTYSISESIQRQKDCKKRYASANREKILQRRREAYRSKMQNATYVEKRRVQSRELYKKHRVRILQKASIKSRLPAIRFIEVKSKAKLRGLSFNLSLDEFLSFCNSYCFYCGIKLLSISLDRVDNSKGYQMDNVVPCCKMCNIMKQFYTQENFINQCVAISNIHKERK